MANNRPRISVKVRPNRLDTTLSKINRSPGKRQNRKPDLEAFCLSVDGHLKKRAYLTTSRTDLAVRAFRNTGTSLPLLLATGRAEIVEFDVFLEEKYQELKPDENA